MYNSILPEKCKVNLSVSFQKFNTVFFSFINFRHLVRHLHRTSLDRTGLLIDRVSVAILPFIMYFTFYPIGIPIYCFIVTFSSLEEQFSVK